MKTKLLFVAAFLVAISVSAQQVDRQKVVVEIATGTWCYYCPGAAMGADDLVANGHPVAIVENHNGDSYANTYSNARNSYYGVSGYPTAFFDGGMSVVGGNHTQSMYNSYLPRVNQRITVPSDFTLEIFGDNTGLDYTVTVIVEQVASPIPDNLVLHVVLTESEIPDNWQGMSEVNFVTRLMAPDQNGTPLDFSSGTTQNVEVSFTIDQSWLTEHCELVAFVQEPGNKQIHQGENVALDDLVAPYAYNAGVMEMTGVPIHICTGEMETSFTVYNQGSEALTSLDIRYNVNDEVEDIYNWTGNLAYGEAEVVDLPIINFAVIDENIFTVNSENPNGQPDENPNNDTIVEMIPMSEEIGGTVYLYLKTDQNAGETSWEVKSAQGQVVYAGGPYPNQPNAIIKDTFDLGTGCYSFCIYDSGGDGICCDYGNGFYRLTNSNFQEIWLGNEFGSVEVLHLNPMVTGIIEPESVNALSIFPNPASDQASIQLSLKDNQEVTLEVYNLVGDKVMAEEKGMMTAGVHLLNLETSDLNKGVYFISVKAGAALLSGKVTIK